MKIGIVTLFYNNANYGGKLQAYALVELLNKIGYEAEQIAVNIVNDENKGSITNRLSDLTIFEIINKIINKPINLLKSKYKDFLNSTINTDVNIRKESISKFDTNIIHSVNIFDKNNIAAVNAEYSTFITGSDQVWNFAWYYSPFFLDFVAKDKKKISYAASIGMDFLTNEQKEVFRNSLKDFDAVSVREKSDVELIKELSPVKVVNTLDPTLLLEREDWDKVCADGVVDDKYLFCYFLGDNKNERKLAKQFAKKYGLKIVTLPHLNGYQKADKSFGDYKLWDVDPEKFISLIKHAEYVFTDSFHAVVFSNIYHKQYFVFNRSSKGEMSSRIYNIMELVESPERFCDTKEKETLEYIDNLKPIDYDKEFVKFEEMKKQSLKFLKDNLGENIQ